MSMPMRGLCLVRHELFGERLMAPGLGDGLFMEPSVRAYARRYGQPVPLAMPGLARAFFEGRDDVLLAPVGWEPESEDDGWLRVSALEAFAYSFQKGRHFADGFFPQVGLDADDYSLEDRRPRISGFPVDGERHRADFIAICPFAVTCRSQMMPGQPPDKLMPLSWWEEFVRRAPLPVVAVGHAGAEAIAGTLPCYGHSLRTAAAVLRTARCVVSVVTGLLQVAGVVDADVVALMGEQEYVPFSAPRTKGALEVVSSAVWDSDGGPVAADFPLERVLEAVGRLCRERSHP